MRRENLVASMLACFVIAGCAGEAPSAEIADSGALEEAAQATVQTQVAGRAVAVDGGEYRDIIVPELQAMLQRKDFPLINVHRPFAGDIPGTDDTMPYDDMASVLDRLPADKDAPIVLYCRTGPMSERAARDLVALGYTNVYNLVGGFNAWAEAGMPLSMEPAAP